jgi:hypothetical protein
MKDETESNLAVAEEKVENQEDKHERGRNEVGQAQQNQSPPQPTLAHQ